MERKTKYGVLRVGDKHSFLTIVALPQNGPQILVRCECGKEKKVRYAKVFVGETKSCGCRRNDLRYDTNLKTYGVAHVAQNAIIRAKTEETNQARYGSRAPSQNSQVRAKMQKTTEERFGVPHAMQNPKIQQKQAETVRKKYGTDNVRHVLEINQKIIETNMRLYDAPSPFESQLIQEKCKETIKQKYGVDNPMRSQHIQEKAKATCVERYGVEYFSQSEIHKTAMIESGAWMDYSAIDTILLEQYLACVWNTTEREIRKYPSRFDKRGKEYHIDHIYSISQGYQDSIPPEIIGSSVNLRILPAADNIRKRRGCDISKEELICRYEEKNNG